MTNHRFNIVFIIIDALRARNLGCYGYPKDISPNIDRFAEESVLFENAYCCNNVTDSSLTSIFSGKYPLEHGIISHARDVGKLFLRFFNGSETKLLPEILKKHGYVTLALDWLGRWHKRGYDYYSGKTENASRRISRSLGRGPLDRYLRVLSRYYNHKIRSLIGENASTITSQAIDLIRNIRNNRFFLFLHYWDLHIPYAPSPKFFQTKQKLLHLLNPTFINLLTIKTVLRRSRYLYHPPHHYDLTKAIKLEFVKRYQATISYIDNEIGKLITFLKKSRLTENTLVIITSDHGESLLEHGIFFDHHGLYDVSIHVPLIMRYVNFPKNKTIKQLIQHIDIVPTILAMLSENPERYNLNGRSLFSLIQGKQRNHREELYFIEEYVQRRAALRTHNHKYIFAPTKRKAKCRYCRRIHNDYEELYDLNKDPEELNNISQQECNLRDKLKEKLTNWLESFNYYQRFANKQQDVPLDSEEEILQKLRYLGYV